MSSSPASMSVLAVSVSFSNTALACLCCSVSAFNGSWASFFFPASSQAQKTMQTYVVRWLGAGGFTPKLVSRMWPADSF